MLCTQCPRRCGAVRSDKAGEGFCRMPALPVLGRAALHHWEEPCLSGTGGAGTVFFSGCTLRCVFCQNSQISRGNFGKPVTVERLREIFAELAAQGAHNIDLVSPTQFSHAVGEALDKPPGVPVVWNSGGYDSADTLRSLEGRIDIYLPDLKYVTPARAEKYSGAEDYPEIAKTAILEMFRQVGPPVLEGGLLKRGLLIRHLLLPGGLNEAKLVMDWVAETFPDRQVLFSLMSQYVPLGQAVEFPEIDRRLRRSEVRAAQQYMADLGLNGYIQEPDAAGGGYVPRFDLTGVTFSREKK